MPTHMPLEDFYITMPELPSHTEVMQAVAANRAESHRESQMDPLWAVVCVLIGAALSVASGVFLLIQGLLS